MKNCWDANSVNVLDTLINGSGTYHDILCKGKVVSIFFLMTCTYPLCCSIILFIFRKLQDNYRKLENIISDTRVDSHHRDKTKLKRYQVIILKEKQNWPSFSAVGLMPNPPHFHLGHYINEEM